MKRLAVGRVTGARSSAMLDRDALRAEALRIHHRYVVEVVEALGFCPWAASARAAGRVRSVVVFGDALGERHALRRDILREIEALEHDERVDVGLLVFPEVAAGRIEFQHLAAEVRTQFAARPERDPRHFALADFHPDAAADLGAPERLVPFIRRSPDPTFQLIRYAALDATRAGAPGTRFVDMESLDRLGAPQAAPVQPTHERIARANLRTVRQLGVERGEALILDILRDRDRSYGRLGVPLPPWRSVAPDAAKM